MLPRHQRVSTPLFKKVLEEGRTIHSPHFSLRLVPSHNTLPSRFSISVSKKVIKTAVARNKLKRRILACVELFYPRITGSYLGVVFSKKGAEALEYKEIQKEIISLLETINGKGLGFRK